jgi:hypothetical protein
MMTDELGISCSIGSHQGEKENSPCIYHWGKNRSKPLKKLSPYNV